MSGRVYACLLATAICWTVPASAQAEKITLETALRRAEKHPNIAVAKSTTSMARGAQRQAGTWLFNPELSAAVGPRFGGSSTMLDFEVGVSQTIELGGKRRYRRGVATHRLRATTARLQRVRQLVRLRVRRAYALAVVAKQAVEVATAGERVAISLKRMATERMAQGAGNQLEINLAAAELGSARRTRLAAQQAYRKARFELASAVGVPATQSLEPHSGSVTAAKLSAREDALVKRALQNRPDLAASEAQRQAASAGVRLARALARPDLAIGVNYAREEGAQQVLVGVSISIPLWNRNRGGRSLAKAQLRRATVQQRYMRLEIERGVRLAYRRYRSANSAVQSLVKDGIGNLTKNLDLSREAFNRGKLSMIQLNLLRRRFVDARLAYLGALKERVAARFALEQAIGGGLGR